MNTALTKEEEKFINELNLWDRKRNSMNMVLYNFFLILGGLVIIVDIIVSISNLTDKFIYQFSIPGFMIGLMLIGLYIFGYYWTKERKLIASIIKKLEGM
jgi:hypothetical membrane protein